jgi:hypothetical protein
LSERHNIYYIIITRGEKLNATSKKGILVPLNDCYIAARISGKDYTIYMCILPDISDSKQSSYSDETGMGRSAPIKVFSHGDTRSVSWTAHFFSPTKNIAEENLQNLRILESLVYPDVSLTTIVSPPPIARIKCGSLLGAAELCVVLKSYTVKFPTDVAWDKDTYMPIKFDVDMNFEVVYQTVRLPGASQIINFGG